MDQQPAQPAAAPAPRWQPLPAIDRRVSGVLVEKAKTTPDQYPLTVNALRAGANQKSNRAPVMQLAADEIEESLERLRQLGAVIEVQGSGRVARYRHLLYEWLGVDRVELAIMAELLLRGDQTVGALRGRAARMEPIPDLAALCPHLDSLKAKGLIRYLTPAGRGSVVTHALYEASEWERLRCRYADTGAEGEPPPRTNSPDGTAGPRQVVAASRAAVDPPAATPNEIASLDRELRDLRAQFDRLRDKLEQHCHDSERTLTEVRRQLGIV